MRRAVLLLGALLWSSLSLAAPPPARPSVDSVIDDLNRTIHFRQVALSPDGARVAWVESVPEKEGPAPDRTLIQVADRASPEASPRPPPHSGPPPPPPRAPPPAASPPPPMPPPSTRPASPGLPMASSSPSSP